MLSAAGPGGAVWGVVAVGVLAVLLVVFVRRLRQHGGSARPVLIGVAAGVAVAGIALVAALQDR